MRKVLDVSLAKKYGWKYKTSLKRDYQLLLMIILKEI